MKTSIKLFALGMILMGFGVGANAQVTNSANSIASATVKKALTIEKKSGGDLAFGTFAGLNTAVSTVVVANDGTRAESTADLLGTDVFLKDFNTYYAKLFDGCRVDSGLPIEIGYKILNHYNELKLDDFIIKSKTLVFSDNLNSIKKILDIENEFKGKIRTSYGIGTWLSNDVPEIKPLNIVIKISDVLIGDRWIPTVKLSDDPGKHTGDPEMIELAKKILSFK